MNQSHGLSVHLFPVNCKRTEINITWNWDAQRLKAKKRRNLEVKLFCESLRYSKWVKYKLCGKYFNFIFPKWLKWNWEVEFWFYGWGQFEKGGWVGKQCFFFWGRGGTLKVGTRLWHFGKANKSHVIKTRCLIRLSYRFILFKLATTQEIKKRRISPICS